MPGKVPTVAIPKTRLVGQAVGVPTSAEMASVSGRGMAGIGEAVSQVGEKLSNMRLVVEQTKAETAFEAKMLDIENRRAQDQNLDPGNQEKYIKEINEAHQGSGVEISLPYFKGVAKQQFGSRANITAAKVQGDYLKKYVDNGRAEFDKHDAVLLQDYLTKTTPQEKAQAILRRDANIDRRIMGGFLTREEGNKRKIEDQKEWDTAHAYQDMDKYGPKYLLKELDNKEGFYRDLGAIEKSKLRTSARAALNSQIKLEKEQKTAQINATTKEFNLRQSGAKGYENNPVTIDELDAAYAEENVTGEFYTSRRHAFLNPIPQLSAPEQLQGDINLTEQFEKGLDAAGDSDGKLADFLETFLTDATNGYFAGEVSKSDYEKHVKQAIDQDYINIISKNRFDIVAAGKGFTEVFSASPTLASAAFNEFFEKLNAKDRANKSPAEIYEEVKKTFLKKQYPQLSGLDQIPSAVWANGGVRVVSSSQGKGLKVEDGFKYAGIDRSSESK